MPDGGRITIETENVRIDEAYADTHAWVEPGRYVLMSVTDSGWGMDRETVANIFDPFFTTKEVGEGTGLGLATVYGLVKQHQGMVHAYSEVGKGTTFKIYLPLVERSARAVGDKIEAPARGGTETILLAEDDETVRELTYAFLEQAGYTVLVAGDGEEALRIFEEYGGDIDLALLDVVMPKVGGRAVFEQTRESRPRMRVIFCSGYSMNAIHTNFVLDEGLTLLRKPYSRDDLLRRLRDVLDGTAATEE
jgi:CheY-like chemotaxis protein